MNTLTINDKMTGFTKTYKDCSQTKTTSTNTTKVDIDVNMYLKKVCRFPLEFTPESATKRLKIFITITDEC
jgi:hypothetical protein